MISRGKKGFTLVEIIAVITIIAVLGVASFFGIRLVNKNITISKLEKITDKVLLAAEVYIETNQETYNQLYNKQNSVIIPLNVLVNEGLLTLENTNIKQENVEKEYIIATLSNGGPGDNDCVNITTEASWNLSKENPIYICNNKSSGTNSIIIGGTNSNIDTVKVQDEVAENDGRYNFLNGEENYITYKNNTYRILLVDRDDSLVLGINESTFGDVFNGKTQKYAACQFGTCAPTSMSTNDYSYQQKTGTFFKDNQCKNKLSDKYYTLFFEYSTNGNMWATMTGYIYIADKTPINGEVALLYNELALVGITSLNSEIFHQDILYYIDSYGSCKGFTKNWTYPASTFTIYNRNKNTTGRKIKLKSCMKITGGTGTEINPYELSDLC